MCGESTEEKSPSLQVGMNISFSEFSIPRVLRSSSLAQRLRKKVNVKLERALYMVHKMNTLGLGSPCGVWTHNSCSYFWCLCSKSWQLYPVHKTQLLHLFVCKTNAAPRLCLIMEDNLMREALRNTFSIIVEWCGFVNLNIWLILLMMSCVDWPSSSPSLIQSKTWCA